MCKKPYHGIQTGIPVACGKCMPCRINRQRLWAHRILLESYMHDSSSFVTLTYDPKRFDDFNLDPRHPQLWFKRLRKAIAPSTVRYYLVGEYGDESQRAHYHLALFGLGPEGEHIISDTWKMGFVQVGDLTPASAAYVAGYTLKKMTSKSDPRLGNRHPEFARMSNRPGIGAPAMSVIADALCTTHGINEFENTGDVPTALRHGSQFKPLGRYLRKRLRNEIGAPESLQEKIKVSSLYKYTLELSSMFKDALADPSKEILTVSDMLVNMNFSKLRTIEARHNVFKNGRNL